MQWHLIRMINGQLAVNWHPMDNDMIDDDFDYFILPLPKVDEKTK